MIEISSKIITLKAMNALILNAFNSFAHLQAPLQPVNSVDLCTTKAFTLAINCFSSQPADSLNFLIKHSDIELLRSLDLIADCNLQLKITI